MIILGCQSTSLSTNSAMSLMKLRNRTYHRCRPSWPDHRYWQSLALGRYFPGELLDIFVCFDRKMTARRVALTSRTGGPRGQDYRALQVSHLYAAGRSSGNELQA
jgi:hypothetical protein